MTYYIYRNSTIEQIFKDENVSFSGYDDISNLPKEAESYIWFYTLPFKHDTKVLVEEISFYFNNLLLIYQQIPSNKNLYVFTLSELYHNQIQTGDFSLKKAIAEYNLNVIQLSEQNINIKVIDIHDFTAKYPDNQLTDWKFYSLTKMQINPKLAVEFNHWFHCQMDAIHLKRKKCIVLDLDNTLWGGVLGEEGIHGIEIGGDYPGNSFLSFQFYLLELYKSGVILTICSKNNESDVLDVWLKNPNIIIKKEHIATYRINWNNKAENIKEIVEELNIGYDSVVFIDDNPSERELVKQFLPMVVTPDFPIEPYQLPLFTKTLTEQYFNVYSLTKEDLDKTQQYKANSKRASLQKAFSNFDDYLKSLEIKIKIGKADSATISRVAQMTQKTNQFNLTTKRYTDGDILSLIDSGYAVYYISVNDKFGDNGISGLIIISIDTISGHAEIDSLLLSCRILGKGIEEAFVSFICNKLKMEGFTTLQASYIATKKNGLAENFYDKLGFIAKADIEQVDNIKTYFLDIPITEFKIKPYYNIIDLT